MNTKMVYKKRKHEIETSITKLALFLHVCVGLYFCKQGAHFQMNLDKWHY